MEKKNMPAMRKCNAACCSMLQFMPFEIEITCRAYSVYTKPFKERKKNRNKIPKVQNLKTSLKKCSGNLCDLFHNVKIISCNKKNCF